MSSAIYLNFKQPVTLGDWLEFAETEEIIYSPNTIGQNVFYRGDVEIKFGEWNNCDLPKFSNGRLDFGAARPRDEAAHLTVSTYYGSNVDAVCDLARAILRRFPATASWNPECSLEGEGWEQTPEEEEDESSLEAPIEVGIGYIRADHTHRLPRIFIVKSGNRPGLF